VAWPPAISQAPCCPFARARSRSALVVGPRPLPALVPAAQPSPVCPSVHVSHVRSQIHRWIIIYRCKHWFSFYCCRFSGVYNWMLIFIYMYITLHYITDWCYCTLSGAVHRAINGSECKSINGPSVPHYPCIRRRWRTYKKPGSVLWTWPNQNYLLKRKVDWVREYCCFILYTSLFAGSDMPSQRVGPHCSNRNKQKIKGKTKNKNRFISEETVQGKVAYCYRQSSVVGLSVSVSLHSVCHFHEPCKNGWTDSDEVCGADLGGSKEPLLDVCPDPLRGMGNFLGLSVQLKSMQFITWAFQTARKINDCDSVMAEDSGVAPTWLMSQKAKVTACIDLKTICQQATSARLTYL